ncbi:hypothetical protein THAOC_11563, partial [Thalassiosira oceanica]
LAFGHHRAQAPALQDSKHGRDSSKRLQATAGPNANRFFIVPSRLGTDSTKRKLRRMKKRRCGLPLLAAQVLRGTSPAQCFTGSPAFSRGMATANTATADTSRLMCASRDDDGRSTSRRRAVASAASLLALQTLAAQPAFALRNGMRPSAAQVFSRTSARVVLYRHREHRRRGQEQRLEQGSGDNN